MIVVVYTSVSLFDVAAANHPAYTFPAYVDMDMIAVHIFAVIEVRGIELRNTILQFFSLAQIFAISHG
ncbi:hypothetical protein EAI98_07985 [Alistipes finegoldii]|nr:MAG: hypothetical protein BHV64_07565 [Alistipes sp. 56_sp_Nov_56_25]RYU23539.1 hypothetical protein EAI98_07985 [Alistipes finegoldii]